MRIARVLSVAFFVALLPTGARAAGAVARLSSDTTPLSYDLHVQPVAGPNDNWGAGPDGLTVAGSETIVVRTTRDLDAIVMNQSRIDVRDASIDGDRAIATADEPIQQLRLQTLRPLATGEHTIRLTFVARSPNPGFKAYGDTAPLLATLFETSLARGVFPCFDEPQFRARFTLHVRAPSAWTVISNMPLDSRTSQGDGTDVHDFAPTPPMPVYLLTFDMGAYAHVDGSATNVPIRVFVRPGKEPQARAILADAEKLLPFYEAFFGTAYPLPKLDIVVVPAGEPTALEGWGAITEYDETLAFGAMDGGGIDGRLHAAEAVAHEMAHQWAGDLVDMRWWRDTFVAEGFAQFSQQRAMATLFPDLHSWISDDRQLEPILTNGVGRRSVPVITDVATDLDDDDAVPFSLATYLKGAAVLRQWQLFTGEGAFETSIAAYLSAHAYGSATFEDFWASFPQAHGSDFGASWLKQIGFPLVNVDVECMGGRSAVTLDQQAYVTDPRVSPSYRSQRWPILLQIDIAGDVHTVLTNPQPHSTFDFPGCGIVSIDSAFRPYARIRYSGDAAAVLGVRPLRERTRLLRDDAAMREGGYLPARDYLDAISSPHLLEDVDLDAIGTTAQQLDEIHDVLRGSPLATSIAGMERTLLVPPLSARPLDGYANEFDARGVKLSLYALANAGDPNFGDAARALFFASAAMPPKADASGVEFGIAAAAGIGASRADVVHVESIVRDNKLLGTGPFFLEHVSDDSLVPGILNEARGDPRIAGGSFSFFLFTTGSMHPKVAYAYLQEHMLAILAGIPAADRAGVISNGAARSLWSAVPANHLIALLKRTFPKDPAAVAQAAAEIKRHWTERRALERQLTAH
jgi:hypothetical protein